MEKILSNKRCKRNICVTLFFLIIAIWLKKQYFHKWSNWELYQINKNFRFDLLISILIWFRSPLIPFLNLGENALLSDKKFVFHFWIILLLSSLEEQQV